MGLSTVRFLLSRSILTSLTCAFLTPPAAIAQQTASIQVPIAPTETVIVTGVFEPVPLSEANRSVVSFNTEDHSLLFHSLVDYLNLDPSVDLQQRAPSGVQADLSIRGATFEQSLVLVNGLRMNDAQSGHHDLDLPIPPDAVSQIEVLHGAGSTRYGIDAFGGVVNLITAIPSRTEFRMRAGFGNFGTNQQALDVSYFKGRFSQLLAASRDFSTGFQPDRDYRSSSVMSESRVSTLLGVSDILAAASDRPFGASQFYGDFNSWERTKAWFASIQQELGKSTNALFGYRRHSDEFVLVRDNPTLYENNHVTTSWQAALRRHSTIADNFTLAYGVDGDGDAINSNNLGQHARNREAGYGNLDFQSLRRLFLSLGAREELFSGGRTEFAPSFSGSLWVRSGLKLKGSVSRAFRLPTYTDLYYSDPANLGNPYLKPESAWDFEGGPEWNTGGRLSAALTAFRRDDRDDIDYVRSSSSTPWQATNISYVTFTGVESTIRLRLPKAQRMELSDTWLTANQQEQPGLTSKYVFNYPSNNALFSWLGEFRHALSARTRVGVTQRVGQTAYAVWDLSACRGKGMVRPYLQLSNLANTGYQEVPGVNMPGRTIVGGIELLVPNGGKRP